MKVLVLNPDMPDHRVQKEAYLAKKSGHKMYFAGRFKTEGDTSILGEKLFENQFYLNITPRNKLGFNLKNNIQYLQNLREEFDFDLIHAHNIYCVYLASKLDIPVVFDDHEYYTERFQYLKSSIKQPKDYVANKLMRITYPKWEKKFAKKYPIITVSEQILNGYKKKYPEVNIFHVPNAPLCEEAKFFERTGENTSKIKTVYRGLNDFSSFNPYRDTTGLIEVWLKNDIGDLVIIGERKLESFENIKSLGYISQKEIFEELSSAHIGLIGYRPHPFHFYINPNKLYNYIHSGLVLIAPGSIPLAQEIIKKFRIEYDENYGFLFSDFSEIPSYIKKEEKFILSLDHKKIFDISKKYFTMNRYQKNIEEAYKIALEI